ncbi:Gfo/Idh/MocA family protein [Fibrella forsythiae]|uniref:Gfo/Idh/MocA family oxidoreductase n=1 Tax=Fibrella forsythiae TaxID=2817061 RepID=A0ABS3JLC8_9BACT|nr:Gfo/Idh/MocA family oxidoreductase [Fibrella forsythiae]MBO0950805.1 Gfo/Idh/MocA family oxidoreductase [Fibrella forsythiae]
MNRRTFIKQSAVATASTTILTFPVYGKNAPSNKVVVGIMGVNSRGAYHAKSFSKLPNVEVAYLCDVEDNAIKNGLDALKGVSRQPAIIKDIRELVARKDFDALLIAAPDHWHAPAALMGVSNGKHVYVEKPCSHNPHESEMLIEARAKYGRLIQVGSQRRSFPTLIEAVNEVRGGIIGNPYFAKAWYTNNRKPIGIGKKIPVPGTLDFNLWQGPAPRQEYRDNLVHYNWHWFWNWGTGEACNNGNHELDCCRWFMGVDFPSTVTSSGGRFAYKDDWQTPDTQVASFEFANGKAISWEGRSCNSFPVEGSGRGFIIYGDKGTLVNKGGGDYQIFDTQNKLVKEIKPGTKLDPNNTVSATGDLEMTHFANFVDSVRGNAQLTAPIEEGHKSVLLCHLANIAQRTGSTLHCDATNGHIKDNKAAMQLWKREYEKGWGMAL